MPENHADRIEPGDSYGVCDICDAPIVRSSEEQKTDRFELAMPDAGYLLLVHWSCFCRALRWAGREACQEAGRVTCRHPGFGETATTGVSDVSETRKDLLLVLAHWHPPQASPQGQLRNELLAKYQR